MTQNERLEYLFRSRPEEWIPLPDILQMMIAQYNARIGELREKLAREGLTIVNRTERVNGQKHSWFKLTKKEEEKM